jgi:ABC-type glycerol-3-phosphate transport system permease component
MADRYFLNIVPPNLSKKFAKLMNFQAQLAMRFFPKVKNNVYKFEKYVDPIEYLSVGLVSYHLLGFVLGLGMFRFLQTQDLELNQAFVLGLLVYVVIPPLLIMLSVSHPQSQSLVEAKKIEKFLLYALRDLTLQVSSGETIYKSMVNISQSGYAESSRQFDLIVRDVNVGQPMEKVLHKHIRRTGSEYLKKTLWQILNSLKTGSDLRKGLETIIVDLNNQQKAQIQNYARELGLWSLVYMMFSVAIPTIGVTMLVILSTFAGYGLSQVSFILFLVLSVIIQIALIAFVKSRRPAVHF